MHNHEYLHDPEWDGHKFFSGVKAVFENRPCTILSIDGAASASNPFSNYPMTVEFEDKTTRSFVYDHQLTRRHG